jgi:BirA family biotin operon repressor/biotin-[acetyl-CoA-carboxylase] ligase
LYNSIQDTLIIGKKVIYLPTCHSTNDIAAEIVHAGLFEEGTVVITDSQLNGRGQRGTKWVASPGENLTFSVILTPHFLPVNDQFLISQTIALAIHSYAAQYSDEVKIKWPNDIYLNGKKICGTLIENSVQGRGLVSSIVGIGLNINQTVFENPRASSIRQETGSSFVLTEEFGKLIRFLDAFYLRLRSMAQSGVIRAQYLENLHGYKDTVRFFYKNRIVEGSVTDVAPQGKLCVKLATEEDILQFDLKEIEWVMD